MPIPTQAVKAIITNIQGEILLLRRNPKTRDSDVWDLPGGLVEVGEAEVAALQRECEEELGLAIKVVEKAGSWSFLRPADGQTVKVQNYICTIEQGEIALSEEHVEYQWVDPPNMRHYSVKDRSFYKACIR